ncbi:MAG: alpha-L-rhamnosidase, partial [Lentisphaerae bacterium]
VSRLPSGLTQSRFPSRIHQIIPPFSLWWVAMVHDYWLWRDDTAFVQAQLPAIRSVLESFRALLDDNSLLTPPNGWNFMDWVREPVAWDAGIPPQASVEPSAPLNLQLALVLQMKAQLEEWAGEALLAERDRQTAGRIMDAVRKTFWHTPRGILADDRDHRYFSQHSQCLAILSGLFSREECDSMVKALVEANDLAPASIYFSHYLLEAFRVTGQDVAFFRRLQQWYQLKEMGLCTTIEAPEPSRSDCHAWGAHPLFHCFASIIGIRPKAPGFRQVAIAPMPGQLRQLRAKLPHPSGSIEVELHLPEPQILEGEITLPPTIAGELTWKGKTQQLNSGRNTLRLAAF